MHILVVNDDGPPSTHSSPYVHSFVRALQQAGHLVSVCLPHTQRSWIGKAHIIGQTVEPLYYRPPPPEAPPAGLDREEGEPDNTGSIHPRPYRLPTSHRRRHVVVRGRRRVATTPGGIGLFHVFGGRPPVDLVVSGPNYGRNTTAVFALSSGTLGGALEAATCRTRAVALSYAFFGRGNHDRGIVAEASRHAVRVIEALVRRWPAAPAGDAGADGRSSSSSNDNVVDLYSVNVPLVAGVSTHKTVYAGILQNYWRDGGCFVEAEAEEQDDKAAGRVSAPGAGEQQPTTEPKAAKDEEERIREGPEGEGSGPPAAGPAAGTHHGHTHPLSHKHFKWQPRFTDIYKSVDEAPPGNDGWAVREGMTSITPLKANFWQAETELHGREFELDSEVEDRTVDASLATMSITESTKTPSGGQMSTQLYALVAYDDPYVQPIILDALRALVPADQLHLLAAPPRGSAGPAAAHEGSESDEPLSLERVLRDNGVVVQTSDAAGPANTNPPERVLQITPYEAIDFAYAAAHPASTCVNSYIIRKALIRKHFLAATVAQWVAKRPASVLARHVPRAEAFEVDYAEFLDDALVEAFDLRASLARNEESGEQGKSPAQREWWILKPSMSDRGQGIRLFSTMEELQAIFDGWEEDFEEDEDEDENEENDDTSNGNKGDGARNDYVAASHLRHFVAQPYLQPPLLLPGTGGRKFHLRAYVLCVGALQVYVYRDLLALFAAQPYVAPGADNARTRTHGQDDGDGHDGTDYGGDAAVAPLDLAAHLTNTCLQDEIDKGDAVRRFWDLYEPVDNGNETATAFSPSLKDRIFDQVCGVTGALFEAAAVGAPIHFQPLANAFEVYGLDFLVTGSAAKDGNNNNDDDDDKGTSDGVTAWLLEVNAFPDFRQTGTGLQGVVAGFWADALRLVVRPMVATGTGDAVKGATGEAGLGQMVLVKDLDLGRR
ncbi:tubulin-tyrosine ligase family protein [Niveomyces insectorum RCEF 264]|uniref:Tubulin-tyrosine ligase family protein n=1 Tax=Niveomyces insectorum RCEF 264 TaxID=1081102 RepID=A0A167VN27_9HYPO|nr:tubulin-tyrosine ligase family protein [Niveomyces insectorum RCEF 264]